MIDPIKEDIKVLEEELIRIKEVEVRLIEGIKYLKEQLIHRDKNNNINDLLHDIKMSKRFEVKVGDKIELIKNCRNYLPGTKGSVLGLGNKFIDIKIDASNETLAIDNWDYLSYIKIR